MLFCVRARFFILAVFLFSFGVCFSQNQRVTIYVNGYAEQESVVVPLSFEWRESWFSQQSAYNYNHNIARMTGTLCALSYADCSAPNNSLEQAYARLGFAKSGIQFFYDINYNDEQYGINQSAFSFAAKKIEGNRNLIFVVVRGTPVGAEEWLSNLNVNDSRAESLTYHEGFALALKQLRECFDKFVEDHQIDLKNSSIVVTGHSRGAAIANLFGAHFFDEGILEAEKIFAYTFASPNVTLRKDANDARYNFIWNIINGEDLVPTLPPNNDKWNFSRFGRTRVIVNSWNCADKEIYLNEYVPKMNSLYEKFLGREYYPFGTGTFIGSKLSDTFTGINKDSAHYYKGFFPLHNKMAKIVKSVFPPTEENQNENSISSSMIDKIVEPLKKRSSTRTKVLIDYAINAIIDMHAMQEYVAWLFALEEAELFSEQQSTIVRIGGIYNGAVVDKKGKIYARIYDGVLRLRDTKQPLAAWQIPIGNFGPVFIGFPSHEDYSLLIYKDSIFPTPIRVKTERYDSEGLRAGVISQKLVGAHSGIVYNFTTGHSTLEQEDGSDPIFQKLKKGDAKLAIKDGRLKENDVSHTNYEMHFDTNGFMEIGITSGLQKIYAAILIGADLHDIVSTQVFSVGLGTQHSLCGPIMMNLEAYLKFAHYREGRNEWDFTLVPAARFMLSARPVKRFQVFTAAEFNFYFAGMNSGVFENGYRSSGIPPMGSGDFRVYTAIQFGLKL